MAKSPAPLEDVPEYPKEWSSLKREAVIAQLDKLGVNANTSFFVARWLDVNGAAAESYFYYFKAIGLEHAHVGMYGRFFERAYADHVYNVAQIVAKEAAKLFPKEARVWLWVARAAAAHGDKAIYESSITKAQDMKVAADEVALVRQHTAHFFKK